MKKSGHKYAALLSSDWNECLAPCGPFDFISYHYPELTMDLKTVFKKYTSNIITLDRALQKIQVMMPGRVSVEMMDSYLHNAFETYKNVPEFIEWCLTNRILFMINTTGMIGYFQRAAAKKLIPEIPVLSAHPMVRYPYQKTDPPLTYNLISIADKAKNTSLAAAAHGISHKQVILMGDSGGDGPHFRWGFQHGAFLIGSMTKNSLEQFCCDGNIAINLKFGITYTATEKKQREQEMQVDFMTLTSVIKDIVDI